MTCYDHDQVTRTPLKLWLKPCKAEDPEQRWFFTQYEVSDHDYCDGHACRHCYDSNAYKMTANIVRNTVLPRPAEEYIYGHDISGGEHIYDHDVSGGGSD